MALKKWVLVPCTRRAAPRGLTLLALACLVAASCTRWQPVRVSPADGSLTGSTDVRVTRRDGSRQILREARSVADSVAGVAVDELCVRSRDGARTRCADHRVETTIPLSDVSILEVREPNPHGTVFLVVGATLGVVVLVGVIAIANSDCFPLCGSGR